MNVRKFTFLAAVFVAFLGFSSQVLADSKPEIVPGEIVIGIRPASDVPSKWANMTTGVGRDVENNTTLHFHRIVLRPGMSVDAALSAVRKRSDVLYAEPNYIIRAYATPDDTYWVSQQYGPQKMQADLAWGIWNPLAQTVIAFVDTGVDYTHPDLTNKIFRDGFGNVIGYNAIGSNAHSGDPTDPIDDHGHGTHCAGIAAAEVNNGTGIAGISGWNGQPGSDTVNTKIMPVKVLDSTGSGTSTSVANGINYAADHGAKVISMSLGGGGSITMQNAVAYAWSKGCVIVAAAGNSNSSLPSYPAAYPNVISVAATDKTDTLTYYSNYGSWVLCAAPGGGNTQTDYIWSTLPTYTAGGNLGTNYGGLNGTSMACPHVAGEAALVWSQNPNLTNSDLKAIIIGNTDPYTPYSGRTIASGAGRVNAYKALLAAGSGGGPTIPPPPTGLTAAAGNGQASLTWNFSSGATSYNVKRASNSGGPYSTVASPTSAAFTDTGLVNGQSYYYVVTAVNSAGESGSSNEAAATPTAPATPAAPTNLRVTKVLPNEIDLAWNDNSNNETGFEVEIYLGFGLWWNIGTLPANSAGARVVGLQRRTTYSFRVRAVNGYGPSAYTNVATGRTL